MLTSIHIEGFKGFKDTLIAPLRKVNLILGGQNVGKTSLLEAVYLGSSNVGNVQKLPAVFRLAEGNDVKRFIDMTFSGIKCKIKIDRDLKFVMKDLLQDYEYQYAHTILTTSINPLQKDKDTWRNMRGVTNIESDGIKFHQFAAFDGLSERNIGHELDLIEFFQNPLAISVNPPSQSSAVQLFDRVVFKREKRTLLDSLRRIEPRLEDMHSLSPDGELRVYLELEGQANAVPLPQLGHGFSRLLHLYCGLLVTEAKVALIDEVENGIHFASLPTLFKGIQDIAANQDIQTLMTTHSWDCIRAAYKTFADAGKLEDFQLIRLERDNDNIRAVVINDEMLETVMEAGYEVR
jgi:AAA15 family ATPase/GTPase